jgi:hypothetical protein
MKTRSLLLTGIVGLTLAGCFVPSINPLYTEKDLVFDPALVGTWGKPDDTQRWVFAREGDKAYTWQVIEKESTNTFRAHLVRLGEQRFLDALLVRTSDNWPGVGRPAVVVRPAHIFFTVELTNSTLQLRGLNPEWIDKLLKEQPKEIAHEWLKEPDNSDEGGRVLLTASTAELQRFVLKYAEHPKAFAGGDPMPRIEVTPGKAATP